MKKTLILCATLALVVGIFAGMMFANLLRNSPSANANGVTTVHVVEHAITDTTLTITGGTGRYVEARGWMLLHARGNPVGSEFDFVYHLVD